MGNNGTGSSRSHRVNHTCYAPLLADDLLKVIASPVSRSIRQALKQGRYRDVIDASVDPASYSCPDRFIRDWQAVSLLSKYPEFDLGINTAEVALAKFKMGEDICEATNFRLTQPYDTPTLGISGDSLLWRAAQKIRDVLGDFSWDAAEPYMSFSSGASTRLSRRNGDPYYKLQGIPEVTPKSANLAITAIRRVPNWASWMWDNVSHNPRDWVKLVPGNRITTVAKNAKTDRTIAIEPDMNMFLQKGIGGLIRNRLRRVGINLDSQLMNQRLALEASLHGKLSTLDLSMASDTVSLKLVERLLYFCPEWMGAIEATRSEFGVLPGDTLVKYHKVSSMGNGFTFELETLLFWALCSSVTEMCSDESQNRCVVYGDDIIVPVVAAGFVEELLTYCGFSLNTEKSFSAGPFRESCGKHYFNGIDVTPFYIRKPIADDTRVVWYANSLRRWSSRPTPGYCDHRYKHVHTRATSFISRAHMRNPCIPDGMGDGALIGSFDEVRPQFSRGQFVVRVLTETAGVNLPVDGLSAYTRKLMRLSNNSTFGSLNNELDKFLNREDDVTVDGYAVIMANRERVRVRCRRMRISQWVDAPVW